MIAYVPLPVIPLFLLAGIFSASLLVFLVLSHRWTSHRPAIELSDWAKEHRFTLRNGKSAALPAPLMDQKSMHAQVRWLISNDSTSLLTMTTIQENTGPAAWNVLIRRTITDWPATALRPSNQTSSLVDLFALARLAQVATNERFIIFGNDPSAAKILGRSHARALLPPDIGLLRIGEYLLLDFSARPFDPIEFGRMIALADQLEKVT